MYVQVVDDSNSPMIDRKDQSGWKRKKSYRGERKQTKYIKKAEVVVVKPARSGKAGARLGGVCALALFTK
jgi:hypothetical protein